MQRKIRTSIGAGIACALVLGLAPSAGAENIYVPTLGDRSTGALTIAPERPLDSNTLQISWKADHAPRPGWKYVISAGSGDGFNCSSGMLRNFKPTWKRRGAAVRFALRPTDESLWCPTDATVQISGVSRAGRFVTLARRKIRILDNTATPPLDPPGAKLRIDVLEGSAMTVHVAGRPDRSAPLSGSLGVRTLNPRGALGFTPSNDLLVKTVSLSVGALPAEPACTGNGRAFPSPIAVNPLTSKIWSASPRNALPSAVTDNFPKPVTYLVIGFDEDPLGLTGCQGPAADGSLRPLTLVTREIGIFGNTPFTMRGTLGELKLADGADATIDMTMVLKTTPIAPPVAVAPS